MLFDEVPTRARCAISGGANSMVFARSEVDICCIDYSFQFSVFSFQRYSRATKD
jgi:hypothetical protein